MSPRHRLMNSRIAIVSQDDYCYRAPVLGLELYLCVSLRSRIDGSKL